MSRVTAWHEPADCGTRYVPGLVLAEVNYFLRDERQAMQLFMQDPRRSVRRDET